MILFSVLIGCKGSEQTNTFNDTKSIINTITVTLLARKVNPYCGGAAPTEEMENERLKGSLANNYSFYITSSEQPDKVIKHTTNELGIAKMDLQPGKYCIKEALKVDEALQNEIRKSNWEIDEDCFQKWVANCNLEFEVKSDSSSQTVHFTHYGRCSWEGPVPCITNTGFPPP